MQKKYSIDIEKLSEKLTKKAYKLSDVQDKIEKVAFDVVRFKNDDKSAALWQVQSADDGDYIVALYEPEEEKIASHWDVSLNKIAGQIQVSYKGDPIVKIASSKLGIPANELDKVAEYLPAKLAENKKLVRSLLSELSPAVRKEILSKYPELI
jgi:hypothetical protein